MSTLEIIQPGTSLTGFGTISADNFINEGLIVSSGTKAGLSKLVVQGTLSGGGTLTLNGTPQPAEPAGLLQINVGDTMELTGPVLNAATTTIMNGPSDTYTLFNSVIDIAFAGGAGVLLLDDIARFGGTITTFRIGDEFVITNGTLTGLSVSNSDTLSISDTGAGAGVGGIDDIIFDFPIAAGDFSIVNGNSVQVVACFAAGTRIMTPRGYVMVEAVREGEFVRVRDGEQPVLWASRRRVDCRRHPEPRMVWPVCIRAGAFGRDRPCRDLWLSPDHAVFVSGVLIPVKYLIDDELIAQVPVDTIDYHHVALPRHDVLLAEGLPTESYLDVADRMSFDNGSNTVALHPDFASHTWEARGCAPLVVAGPILAAARGWLREHAEHLRTAA